MNMLKELLGYKYLFLLEGQTTYAQPGMND